MIDPHFQVLIAQAIQELLPWISAAGAAVGAFIIGLKKGSNSSKPRPDPLKPITINGLPADPKAKQHHEKE